MSLRRLIATLTAAALLVAPTALAAELKIGVVDTQAVLAQTDDGKAAQKRLETWLNARKKEVEAEDKALMKESDLLRKQASAMNQETLMQKQSALQQKGMEFAKKVQTMQAEAQQKELEEVKPILDRINAVIGKISQRDSLSLVLEKRASGIAFMDNSLDYTAQVVRQYNTDYKGKPAKKAAAQDGN